MLVLTRKRGQVVYIGDDIEIHLLDCDTNHARIGIQAPKDVNILREEAKNRAPNRNRKQGV